MPPKKSKPNTKHPYESWEQAKVVAWLEDKGLLFCHVPNGVRRRGRAGMRQGAMEKSMGVQSGVPDLLVFDNNGAITGVALEMKRVKEARPRVSTEQKEWLEHLEERGWLTKVAYGHKEAIAFLKDVYDV